jgi:hypothetical protein
VNRAGNVERKSKTHAEGFVQNLICFPFEAISSMFHFVNEQKKSCASNLGILAETRLALVTGKETSCLSRKASQIEEMPTASM